MKKILSLALTVVMLLSLTSCGDGKTPAEVNGDEGNKILAVTILPEKGLLEAVAGEGYEVVAMVPPGSSPENYEPSPMEMEKLSKAEIFFSIGVAAENTKTFASLKEKVEVVPLHEIVAADFPELEIDGGRDPHIWLSPSRSARMVEIMAEKLGLKYPEDKDMFKANADSYIDEIAEAAGEIRKILEGREGETFISFHPAFNYFADEFNLNMMSLEKHGKEATPVELKEIIDIAKEKEIHTIFTQAESSSRQSEAFAEEVGAKIVTLKPLSEDYVANLKIMAEAFKIG